MCVCGILPLLGKIVGLFDMNGTLENLLLGVFASAFVALVTYIGAYHIEKKKTIGLIKKYCCEYISEFSNLVPLLIDISETGICSFCWEELISKIKNCNDIHQVIIRLCKIHEERLYTVEGFFPVFRKSKNNLTVHRLIIAFAKVNAAIQYCDVAFMLNNSIVYKMERDDINYSDEKLKEHLKTILQHNDDKYEIFLELLKQVNAMSQPHTVFDPKCEEKCS